MQTRLINPVRDPMLDCGILSYLPLGLAGEISSVSLAQAEEIRLRVGGGCSLTGRGKNIALRYPLSRREMDETVKRLSDGSLYAHRDTINRGYIVMSGGIRVGICGRAVTEGGRITGIYDVTSLCIRIPHRAPDVGSPVCELLEQGGFCGGVLIYSPPGVGKTTLLRAVIARVASKKRTAVIDTRGELACFLPGGLFVDLLSGYPRGVGIEIAARTLSPELIVCDEIGAEAAEAEAIASAHNCGVALLASSHARSACELMKKRGIALLHSAGIFSHYVGISRRGGDYDYTVTSADEV